jgi:GNAT superfamily N-acetyltransferase
MIVRPASPKDAAGMAEVLNIIIAIGGTTAHQHSTNEAKVRQHAIDGPDVLSAVVAEADSEIIGWQSVELEHGEAHIGTFVRPGVQAKGIGAAMFTLTCAALRERGEKAIIASIRADNVPGLAYYARIGFRDFAADPDFTLEDGRKVGRIHRRFDLHRS